MNYLLALLAGLQLSDGLMTAILVNSDIVREGNTIMEPLISDGSFITLKVIGAIACVAALKLISKRCAGVANVAGSLVVVFYLAVITWNLGIVIF